MADLTSGTAAAIGLKAAGPIIASAIQSVGTSLKNISSHAKDKLIRDLRIGFSDFLISSYNKCQQVKTLLSGDSPVPLLKIYVNVSLTCNTVEMEDFDLIEHLEKYPRIVVSGSGGAGKSMLMKYLTVSRFENGKGKIPLFVELRNLNDLTKIDLLQFTYSSCTTAKNKVSYSSFESVMSSGGFILILDGFDEIDLKYRDDVERQILEIDRKFPDAIVIVSSRVDPRFKGWQNFHTFSVNKLTQKQSVDVITRAHFDDGIKKRFIKEIPILWKTHETFLSNPLLATIMLITFGKFSEISPKVTLFYKLAFQTLFREHDAHKEQFKRPMHSSLDLDDFERSFAAFCALSYTESKFSFSEQDAVRFADKALRYARVSCQPSDFIKDLTENVCMLQKDGLDINFVHRSFQEYFCAVFAVGYHEDNVFELINSVARRDNDNTLLMIKEIDVSKLESKWLLPALENFQESLNRALEAGTAFDPLTWIFSGAMVMPESGVVAFLVADDYTSSILRSLVRLYPEFSEDLSYAQLFGLFQQSRMSKAIERSRISPTKRLSSILQPSGKDVTITFKRSDEPWLREMGLLDEMSRILSGLGKLRKHVLDGRKVQASILRIPTQS